METKTHNTVCIALRKEDLGGDRLLIGESMNRFIRGYWAFPGGHIEPGETMFDTACHECPDETGLTVAKEDLRHVGNFTVIYTKGKMEGVTVNMHFLEARRWSGTLRPDPKDFSQMTFLGREEMLAKRLPPADGQIIVDILDGKFFEAKMACGADLTEVLSIEFSYPSHPTLR